MANFTPEEIKVFSFRIEECLKNENCRKDVRTFLKKYNRIRPLEILDLYEKICEIASKTSNWDDKQMISLIDVDGIDYPENAANKYEDVKEQCCYHLQRVHREFIEYLKQGN